MTRPAIGICAAIERARFGSWDQEVALLPRGYADAVQSAGGIALVLPPDDVAAEHPGELLDRLDGWEHAEAVNTGFDPVAIRAASELRIDEQSEIGRGIAERFLAEAARATAR